MRKRFACAYALASCAGVSAATAMAQDPEVYGVFDEYAGVIGSSSGARVTGLNDGAVLRSRLGVRGAEALAAGVEIKYDLEMGVNADTGTAADASRLFDRQAWVGVASPLGELRAGRQNTDIFLVGGAIDYTERTTFGSVVNTFGIPSRYDNDLSYKTPRWAGIQASLHYALPENAGTAHANRALVQAALDVQRGAWRFGYAGLRASPDARTALVRERIWYHNAYLNYRYGRGTLYAAAVRSNNSTAGANGLNTATILSNVGNPNNYFAGSDPNARRYYDIWQLSADYRVTQALRVGALAGVIHDTSGGQGGARGASAGGYYELSRRTTLYAFLALLRNQAGAGFRFSSSAAPSANLAGADVNGRRLTGLQVGMVHRF
jgi:predicted porin